MLAGGFVVSVLDVALARLPGLDNQQVVRAMGSADDAYFTIWTRAAEPRGPAPSGPPN